MKCLVPLTLSRSVGCVFLHSPSYTTYFCVRYCLYCFRVTRCFFRVYVLVAMHSSSSSTGSSSALSKSPSFSSLVQYVFFAAVLYVFAGAPLQTILSGTDEHLVTGDVKGLENLVVPDEGLVCEEHRYKGVHVLSREPLVVYIEGFLSAEEADGVVGLR